jgi:hypothetical protein
MSDEKRVVLIKPGDVLLIGGVNFASGEHIGETMTHFKEMTGMRGLVLFAEEIQLDTLTSDDLRELLARSEAYERRDEPS